MRETGRQLNQEMTIWRHNPVLVQLLGLSPVLAVSTTLVNGIALGVAAASVLLLSCITVSLLKKRINYTWRFTVYLLIMASYTTALNILMQCFYLPLHQQLGIYVPLICCNIAILVHLEVHASRQRCTAAIADALKAGIGYFLGIAVLAAARELLTTGSLFHDWQLLLPSAQSTQSSTEIPQLFGFASTPAMALIMLGLLIALKNFADAKLGLGAVEGSTSVRPIERVRVTGKIGSKS